MIKSMTGYGSAKGVSEKLEISIELRAVNNRYLDTSVKIPRLYLFAEESIKKRVQKTVFRGKVDVFINVGSSKADDVVITVNEYLAEAYIMALNTISEKFKLKNNLTALDVGRLPDVLRVEKQETDSDTFTKDVLAILDEAVAAFDDMRRLEGEKLQRDIINRLDAIENLTAQVERLSPATVDAYRTRLEQRMNEVLQDTKLDENRILMEAAIFADRVAVDEEITRLNSHISQLRDLLKTDGAVGRKLDFLLQELNREANTIGSKCNDSQLSKIVIELKAEIEKIREQVQNIE